MRKGREDIAKWVSKDESKRWMKERRGGEEGKEGVK